MPPTDYLFYLPIITGACIDEEPALAAGAPVNLGAPIEVYE